MHIWISITFLSLWSNNGMDWMNGVDTPKTVTTTRVTTTMVLKNTTHHLKADLARTSSSCSSEKKKDFAILPLIFITVRWSRNTRSPWFYKEANLCNCLFFIFLRPLSSYTYSTLYNILNTNPLLNKNRCAESAPAWKAFTPGQGNRLLAPLVTSGVVFFMFLVCIAFKTQFG